MDVTFGRYRLLERLGKGGMAEVFKAKSFGVEGFEKILVIKRILPELSQNRAFVEMFIHEAKLSVRLSHANIVQVFDLGIAPPDGAAGEGAAAPEAVHGEGAYFMAMEYVHGFDLATLLSRCRRQRIALPIALCVFIAAEVAKGLDHAHRRRDEQMRPLGIVHRDVSPQNVLLSFEGEVKVTDFGIAKAFGAVGPPETEDTRSRKLEGKYGYMSPEQARGESVDARSDLYSLGIVLYECLAGVNPFTAPTTFETMRRAQAGEFPPVELLRPDVPKDLVALLRTAMTKAPDGRFSDAGRMYEALLAFLYAHGSRSGAHELADFLAGFRGTDDASAAVAVSQPFVEGEGGTDGPADRTPVEGVGRRSMPSYTRFDSSVRFVAVDRAVEMGERREITALVVEPLSPAPAPVLDRAVAVMGRYGGRMHLGDTGQLVSLFGLDEHDGRDTEVATRCALVVLRLLAEVGGGRAGLHSARVLVGAEGAVVEDERLTALLATARELCRTRPGRCAVSPAAARHLRGHFGLEPVTGDDHAVALGAEVVKDVRGAGEGYGRFVGRKDELRRIGEVLAAAARRSAQVVTLRGDNGVGKSRLVYEVERRLRRGGYNVALYTASCPPRGREISRSGLSTMLQVLCGVTDGDAPERIRGVAPRLRALGLHAEEVSAVLAALGVVSSPTPPDARAALRAAFARTVASLCEDRPHVFVWDSAHAMDDDSFSIAAETHLRLANARLVFAFVGRAGFSHPLERAKGHVALDLTDLPEEDAARLVALRLGVDEVPESVLSFVKERAGGHPLFIEEVLKGLLDAKAVTVEGRRVAAMRLVGQELALPKTLRGLAGARVARLEPEARTTLQAAAILGDAVEATVVAAMLDRPMSTLERSFAVLERRDLLVHTGPSELRFTSPIVREVVVDALTPDAAREMHAAAGHALERVLGGSAADHASRIATHFYEAGEREKAAAWFAQGAARRLASRELEAAAREYARALELTDPPSRSPAELTEWLEGLGLALRFVRTAPEAQDTCDRVIARADQAGDVGERVQARLAATRVLGASHRFEGARQRAEEAETIADGAPEHLKAVLLAQAELATRQGDFARAKDRLQRIQPIVGASGDKLEEHRVLCALAQSYASGGDPNGACEALERCEALLPDDAAAACERQKIRALVAYFSGDFRAAVAAAEGAFDRARALGFSYEMMINLHNLGDALVRLEDYPRAYGALRQSLALCDEGGHERHGQLNRTFLAYLDAVAGDEAAEETLRRGIRYAASHEFTWDELGGRGLLALLLRRRGDVIGARAELERVREIARRTGHRLMLDESDVALRALAG